MSKYYFLAVALCLMFAGCLNVLEDSKEESSGGSGGSGGSGDGGGGAGSATPTLASIQLLSTTRRTPFNGNFELIVQGVMDEDQLEFFSGVGCSGTPLYQETLSGVQNFSHRFERTLNPGMDGAYDFSVQVSRPEEGTQCFSTRANYRTVGISAGGDRTCARLHNGLFKCWGAGTRGALGNGGNANYGDGYSENGVALDPVPLGSNISERAIKVVTDFYANTCALTESRRLYCFGAGNSGGILGTGSTQNLGDGQGEMQALAPLNLGTSGGRPLPVWDFDLGGDELNPLNDSHACALLGERESALQLKCWGGNGSGQLGISGGGRGDDANEMGDSLPFVDFGPARRPIAVSVGQWHSCALLDNFQVVCWGGNSFGQLGLGHTNDIGRPGAVVDLGTNRRAVAISAGRVHNCALLDNGGLKCWGSNTAGRLGLGRPTFYASGDDPGDMGDNLPFVNLGSGQKATAVSAGGRHTCAILENGGLKCWGDNIKGQLGHTGGSVGYDPAQMGDNLAPIDLGMNRTAVSVSAGAEHTCAVLSDGAFKCWGSGDRGQLLNQSSGNTNTPASTSDLSPGDGYYPVRGLSMGVNHACAVIGLGLIKCWGNGDDGKLGRGNTDSVGHANSGASDQLLEIGPIDLGTGVSGLQVAAGTNHSCALIRGESGRERVACWGRNELGQVGAGNSASVPAVGDVAAEMGQNLSFIDFGEAVLEIAAGEDFSCVRLESERVKCWGKNDVGQLGLGHTNTVGDTTAVDANAVAIDFPGTRTASALTVGKNHACALLNDQSVVCWGGGNTGQLGRGNSNIGDTTTLDGVAPIGGLSATIVVAGNEFTCAVEATTQLVRCWGAGANGRLGSGGMSNQNTPGVGLDLRTGADNDQARLLSLGNSHSCAVVLLNGADRLVCWGGNNSGQLAQGDDLSVGGSSATPVTSYQALNLGPILQLSLGGDQSCIVDADFKAQCWGENGNGQLGLGNTYNFGDANGEVAENTEKLNFGGISGIPFSQLSFAGLAVERTKRGHTPFNGTLELNFSGLEDGDGLLFYPDGGCDTFPFPFQSLSAADLTGGSYSNFRTFNLDLQQRVFSARIVRGGSNSRSHCFTIDPGYNTAAISAGGEHTCALLNNNLFKCWGEGNDGRLGSGAIDDLGDDPGEDGLALAPLHFGDVRSRARKVVAGKHNVTCALSGERHLYCFGQGDTGELGSGATDDLGDAPGEMETLAPVNLGVDASGDLLPVWNFDVGGDKTTGVNHICALVGEDFSNTALKCWGNNSSGQLGLSNNTNYGDDPSRIGAGLPAVSLGGGLRPVAVALGNLHTCALSSGGGIKCWGDNNSGQLGLGNTGNTNAPGAQVNLGTGHTAVALSAGASHTCALLDNGQVKCWGANASGQLGLGNTGDTNAPGAQVNLGTGHTAVALSAGASHTCALLDNGQVKCWGANTSGQLGLGNTTDTNAPGAEVNLGTGHTAVFLSAGGAHTCARLNDNTFKCWGAGGSGRLLNGANNNVATPGQALNLADNYDPVRALSMGRNHACAVYGMGLVKCWGDGSDGKLGQGTPTGNTDSVGHAMTGALDELDEIPPVNLETTFRALDVTVGVNHSCAIIRDLPNQYWVTCWGKNDVGQLGVNTTSWASTVGEYDYDMGENLEKLNFDQKVLQIEAGEDFTCALLSDKSVRCWGVSDVGQLGDNTTDSIGDDESGWWAASTVDFPSGETPAAITVGTDHACARFESGNVLCWGGNAKGQLGISGSNDPLGDDELVSTASVINLGTNVKAERVVAGDQTTCVVTTTGEVKCWGDNTSGEVGVDALTTTEYDQPQAAVDLVNVGDNTAWLLGLGDSHACVSLRWSSNLSRGELVCWGNNGFGQLGRGNTIPVGDGTTPINSGAPLSLGGILALTLAGNQACATNADYRAQCWGEGSAGQLGYGATDNLGDSAGEISSTTAVLDFGVPSLP